MRFLFETDKNLVPILKVEQKLLENNNHDDFNSDLLAFMSSDLIKDLQNPELISKIVWESFAITQKFSLDNCNVDLVVFNNNESNRLRLSDDEKASAIMHELGHIYNRNPEIKIPNLQDCLAKGLNYEVAIQKFKEEKDKDELFADSYVIKNGLKNELVSCLNKSINDEAYFKMKDSLLMRLNFIKSNNSTLIGERKK